MLFHRRKRPTTSRTSESHCARQASVYPPRVRKGRLGGGREPFARAVDRAAGRRNRDATTRDLRETDTDTADEAVDDPSDEWPETRERMWNRYVINRLTTRQLLKTHRQPAELGLRRAEHYEWFPTGITVSGRSGPFVTVVSPRGDLRKAAKSGRSATTPYTYFSSPVHRLPSAFCTGAGK